MSFRLFHRTIGTLFFALAASIFVSVLHAQPVSAAGETYTWKDYRTIVVSGGDIKNNDTEWNFNELYLSVDEGGPGLQGDQIGIFGGSLLLNKGPKNKCYFGLRIYVYKGNVQGMVWSPPPYGQGQSAVPGGYPGDCEQVDGLEGFLESSYHNKYVDLKGTRPANPNAPERDDEKRWDVYVFAPDPLSKVPPSDTVYIYKSDGTKVGEMSSPFSDDSGAANWPPDQTPASMRVTFKIEPGDYVVCDTYVAKECNYAKAPANQKFKKEKYKSGSIQIGKAFLTPDKKRIRGHVEYHVKAPCGSTVSVSPVTITLTGPDGKTYAQQTNAGNSKPSLPGESEALCTKDVALGLYAEWNDMPAGNYKACATGGECVTFTKPEDDGVDDFTIVVNGEQIAPPNEQVCTSGEGVAGALAWVICPATQLIASATDFFENNIIVPFMTVSPLTTNAANPIYVLWQNFRDLANVGFIVLLFISIFSIALSKYGLKRVLPRLLVVAIGINLSYFIVAFVVDAFNIFGGGISQLVTSALQQAGTTQLNEGTSAGPVRSIFTLGGAALLTILLTGGAAIGWLFSFLGLAALVVVVVVIILIVRQLAIIMLVVLSPLAILMYLLPNTEGWFKKWRQMLIQLLMMYPMIVLLFASGKVFGIVLQQPDFKIAGDGVTDEVAQAVRVILQFLVYVIPLVFLPATFAASGALMGKGFALLANNKRTRQLVQKPGKAFGEGVVKPMRQEAMMRAANRGGRIGQMAGFNMRRKFKQEQQARELDRARQQYIAGHAADEGFAASAAGIGGQTGATRVRANALNTIEKARKEDVKNESALLQRELRNLGIGTKELNNGLTAFLRNPANSKITGTARDASGNPVEVDLAQRQDLMRAALMNAAAAGEVGTIENARISSGVDQGMLDEVIRENEGTMKGKGGYHLATNFGMGHGRDTQDALGRPINYANPAQAETQLRMKMQQQRIVAMSKSGAASIAGMKRSVLEDTARVLDPARNPQAAALLGSLSTSQRTALRDSLDRIIRDQTTINSSEGAQAIRKLHTLI